MDPAVDQVWSEFFGIICSVTEMMKPFLQMFGIEEGNGLSPFAAAGLDLKILVGLHVQFYNSISKENS